MLTHPTLDLLAELGLHGMAKGFRDMVDNPEAAALGHAEWLGILLDRESTLRQQKRFESRAKTARLRHLAAVEDVDYRTPRGLDRAVFLKLAGCDWIREHRHCLLTGPSGVGKFWPGAHKYRNGLFEKDAERKLSAQNQAIYHLINRRGISPLLERYS